MNPLVSGDKLVNRLTLIPTGSIDIEPYGISSKSPIEVMKNFHETVPVSSIYTDKTITAQKWCHPACEIEPFLMLACGRNPIGFSFLCPSLTQSRMQSKSRLILKDHCLVRTQIFEFFLTCVETFWPPLPWLEDKHNWPASDDTLTDASSSGPAGPSILFRTLFSDVPPVWDHPIENGSAQKPEEISPDSSLPAEQSWESAETDALASVCFLELRLHESLPRESSDSNSSGINLKHLPSNPVSVLPGSEVSRQSLNQPMPQECSWQTPLEFPWLPLDELCRMNS